MLHVWAQDIPPQDLHGAGNAAAVHLHHAMRTLMGDFTDRCSDPHRFDNQELGVLSSVLFSFLQDFAGARRPTI